MGSLPILGELSIPIVPHQQSRGTGAYESSAVMDTFS